VREDGVSPGFAVREPANASAVDEVTTEVDVFRTPTRFQSMSDQSGEINLQLK